MTDTEIIKALECCTTKGAKCSDCPAFKKVDRSYCKKYFRGAIDLINRQKAEIERLNNNISAMSITNGGGKGMTAKEIIESIDFNLSCGSDELPTTQEDLVLIKSVLEKQIPKKPDFVNYDCDYFICPCCKNAIYSSRFSASNLTDQKFCLECGQALDWSDDND